MGPSDPGLGIGGVVHEAAAVEESGRGGAVLCRVYGADAAVVGSVCACVDGPGAFVDEAAGYGPTVGGLGPLCVGSVLRLDGEASGELEESANGEGIFCGVGWSVGGLD